MNPITLGVGVAMIGYGAFTTVLRITRPHAFRKLEPMQRYWGARAGYWIHVLSYSILPVLSGIAFIIAGVARHSLF